MSRKRRPFVAVETDVAKDESFAVLADICGYGRDEALGRIIRLWAWCADRRLTDAPIDCPGYAVPRGVIERFLGPHGIDGILGGGVDEFALGREFRDGLIYLRGTDVTVASMRARSAGSVTGGQTRAREVLATSSRGPNGEFVAQLTFNQHERGETTTVTPPITTVDPRSQIPDPRSDLSEEHERSAESGGPGGSAPLALESDSTKPGPPRPARTRTARSALPELWTPDRSPANLAAEETAKARGVNLREELLAMRDWAKSITERKADWDATWRNWIRRAKSTTTNGVNGQRVGRVEPRSHAEYGDGDQKL